MPPKATLAPRLWQSVSSTTNQSGIPGTTAQDSQKDRQTSSQFQAAARKRRKAAAWCGARGPVVSQTRLIVGAQADDPARDQDLEGLEDFDPEAVREGSYQRGEARDKLIHGAGLRANSVFGVL